MLASKLLAGKVLMLARKVAVSRRARRVARLPDHSRPHGRRRGYAHGRLHHDPSVDKRPPVVGLAVMAMVFLYLMLVVAGALKPSPGPLIKHEPVTSTRVR